MRSRAVLVVLGLLLFTFCSVGSTQAALDARYSSFVSTYNGEHPWQESESPPFGDDDGAVSSDASSTVIIVIGPATFIIIRPSRVVSVPNEIRGRDDWSRGKN